MPIDGRRRIYSAVEFSRELKFAAIGLGSGPKRLNYVRERALEIIWTH
jgi:hypothetical protein